jgi:hypothetical protein
MPPVQRIVSAARLRGFGFDRQFLYLRNAQVRILHSHHRQSCACMLVRKPLELPPNVAKAFVKDMRAYFAEKDGYKRDTIAVSQLHALKEHQGPREKPLVLSDVKAMFREMKGVVS